ncbi:MAG: carbohydrate porin [Acidithiobacillus sp.]
MLLNFLPPSWPDMLHLGGRIDGEYVRNVTGGRECSAAADLFAYGHLRLDTRRLGLGDGHIYLQVLAALNAHGNRPDGGAGLIQAVSNLYAGQHLRLTKFYYTAYRGPNIYRFGILNVTDYFNVVNGAQYLLNSSFSPVPDIADNIAATPTTPYSGLGVTMSHRWQNDVLRAGFFQGDSIQPFTETFSRGSFSIVEWDHQSRLQKADVQWQLGAWQYVQRRELAPRTGPAGNGLYGAVAIGGQQRGAFVMASRNLSGGNPVTSFVGAGMYFFGLLPGRSEDVTALGLANAWLQGGGVETVWELSYRLRLADDLFLRPDLQYSPHPAGIYPSSLTALLRIRWSF